MSVLEATPEFVPFVDVMGSNSHLVPAVPQLPAVALYATGSDGVEATAQQIARFKAVGIPVILIDQTPSLSVWASGLADVADVEALAGTFDSAARGARERQSHGWDSTIYISQDSLDTLEGVLARAGVLLAKVFYGIANYNDSIVTAENALRANPRWVYVQYGDPASNPDTLVPGTNTTLTQAQADIDIAKYAWWAQFDHNLRPPVPKGPFRHLTEAGQTLAELAAGRKIDVRTLIEHSADAYSVKDLGLLESAKLPAGIPWYTLLP